jgi:signal peptidase I
MRSQKFRPGWAILTAALLVLLAKAFVLDAAIVDGRSMLPTLEPGSIVLVLRCAYGLRSPSGYGYLIRWSSPREGEVVAAASPRDGLPIVKRVAADSTIGSGRGLGADSLFLLGDNPPESLDSRDYGPIPIEAVSGRVLLFGRWPRP